MRELSKSPSDSDYVNIEVALNELLSVARGSGTADQSNVSDLDTAQTLIAANQSRRGLVIFNDSSVILYVSLDGTATTSNFAYKVNPSATLELYGEKNFRGSISGIWASDGSGAARITEFTE